MSLDPKLVTAVQDFEGFVSVAFWDYKQWTNGWGTKAHYPHEAISRATADLRLMVELEAVQASVDHFKTGLSDGLRNALTDLTYNTGAGWMHHGLGEAVTSGDMEAIKAHILMYDMAGGRVLPGLLERRKAEVSWIT